jgi:RNA polymerase primary sigma factor
MRRSALDDTTGVATESEQLSEPIMGAIVDQAQPPSMDEAKEAIAARGRERGFVTSEELIEGLSLEDLTPEQLEEFLTQIEEHLRQEGIDIIEVPGEEFEAEGEPSDIRLPRDEELLKAPTNDPVRMYLKEIGKVPLLTAAQ